MRGTPASLVCQRADKSGEAAIAADVRLLRPARRLGVAVDEALVLVESGRPDDAYEVEGLDVPAPGLPQLQRPRSSVAIRARDSDSTGSGLRGLPDPSGLARRAARPRRSPAVTSRRVSFSFVDLFAGVGGLHATAVALGGRCVLASEIDRTAADVYERNWGLRPEGDVIPLTSGHITAVPAHDLLLAGFPCQPFSKSGQQRGLADERGSLFFSVRNVLRHRRPAVVLLENVRNIAGPRQRDTWRTIVQELRLAGYRTPSEAAVMSPHLLPPEAGGSPQVRERVYILGTYVGRARALAETDVEPLVCNQPLAGWKPERWDVARDVLLPDVPAEEVARLRLRPVEQQAVDTWNDLLARLGPVRLPGFPLWADTWHDRLHVDPRLPVWKQDFLRKNERFFLEHHSVIRAWQRTHDGLADLPVSRRKLEWQAQDAPRDLWRCVLQMRPSGIRVKRPTYLPALVAMNQTSVVGPARRKISPAEAARLQGFPPTFSFGSQPATASYRQMGNAVHVGTAIHVLRRHLERDAGEITQRAPGLLTALDAEAA